MRRSLSLLSLFLPACLGLPLPEPVRAGGVTVERRDTLWRIAHRCGTTPEVLSRLNGLTDPTQLQIGRRLHLPQSSSCGTDSAGEGYTVGPGDTLYAIARRCHVNFRSLLSRNGLRNPDALEVGQRIQLPDDAHCGSPDAAVALQPGSGLSQQPLRQDPWGDVAHVDIETVIDHMNYDGYAANWARRNPQQARLNYANALRRESSSNAAPLSRKTGSRPGWRNFAGNSVHWAGWWLQDGVWITEHQSSRKGDGWLAVDCAGRHVTRADSSGNWEAWSPGDNLSDHQLIEQLCQEKERA